MSPYKIFIVEDNPWYGQILEYQLSLNPDYVIHRFTNGADCLRNLHLRPDLITIDLSLPDIEGEQLFDKIREQNQSVPVIVISAQEEISVAVSLLKRGIADYIPKDENTKDLLWSAVLKAREAQSLRSEVEQLREELGQKYAFEADLKGRSPALHRIFSLMEKAARTNINVSITGATGTGKEMVAKAIHYNGDRRKKAFVAVNMAAIPAELIESELFGYEKGAFTGAASRKIGKFEEANGGTIFLDEVAELDLSLQSKLLRVLQERELCRIGGNDVVKLNLRLIVATHKDLAEEMKEGRFREDLYYRILGLPIELPPLCERGNDVLILAKHFLDQFAKENKLGALTLATDTKEKLLSYPFPGNVRELKAIIELAAVMCDGQEIRATDLSFPTGKAAMDLRSGGEKSLREHTNEIISHYLEKYNNDIPTVAEKLDIGKSTIYRMKQNRELEMVPHGYAQQIAALSK